MTVKHRSDDPPGRELVRVVDLYKMRVVFLEKRRGVLTANSTTVTRRLRARGRES